MDLAPRSRAERPVGEHPSDVVPLPAEFAGWPRLGVESARLSVGPLGVDLRRIDRAALDSLERWARAPGADRLIDREGWAGLDIQLEFTRSDRPGYLALVPGQQARLWTWRESGGLAMVTHGAALLVNEDASRGIVVMARQLDPDLDLALQNVLRVAAAWRLAVSGRGLLLHAAALDHDGAALLLLGPSGAGKSTALRLSPSRPALADDIVILTAPRTADGVWLMHPAPLWADGGVPSRSTRLSPLPIAGALRLHHASSARVDAVSRASSAATLLAHAPFLCGASEGSGAELASRFVRDVPCAALRFPLEGGFWPSVEAWLAAVRSDASRSTDESPTETRAQT
jgi:hypothetical protein